MSARFISRPSKTSAGLLVTYAQTENSMMQTGSAAFRICIWIGKNLLIKISRYRNSNANDTSVDTEAAYRPMGLSSNRCTAMLQTAVIVVVTLMLFVFL